MSKKVPLVLSDPGELQRLQPVDKLSPEGTGLVGRDDFDELQRHFRLLCHWLVAEGFEVPYELVGESEKA